MNVNVQHLRTNRAPAGDKDFARCGEEGETTLPEVAPLPRRGHLMRNQMISNPSRTFVTASVRWLARSLWKMRLK
jgi:hypothetical protein